MVTKSPECMPVILLIKVLERGTRKRKLKGWREKKRKGEERKDERKGRALNGKEKKRKRKEEGEESDDEDEP